MHWPHAATRTECSAQGIPCDCPIGAFVLPHRVIWLKLDRATHLTVKLGEEIKAFLARETDGLGPYNDRSTGEVLIRQQLSRVVPMSLSLKAGEVLYQLRSALDHMACLLIRNGGGKVTNKSQFPIERFRAEKPKDLARFDQQIAGVSAGVRAMMESWQPYHLGPNRDRHWLAILKKLNNLDKHQALVMYAVAVNQLLHVGTRDADGMEVLAITVERPFDNDPAGELIAEIGNKTLVRSLVADVVFSDLAGHGDVPVSRIVSELQFATRQAILRLGAFLKPGASS
jgi:hypothetical protein